MKKVKIAAMAIAVSVLLMISGCGKAEVPNAKNWPVEDFSFTDQDGASFSKKDLKGKVWVADFIFTNCEDVCLPMTANMAKLQKKLKDKGIKDVEFVSFSIDPAVDNPKVLKEFGSNFAADFSSWHFLTGYEQEEIEEFAKKSFKTIVAKPEGQDQVIHGTDFYLMDKEGKIINYYTGLDKIPFDEIVKHIKILQKN
ncbi:cytochrome c oxidase assembly protein [Bacillus sp. M6-12]|uniref:SCO family protein n=1 Tax=Bacillus sp. M6-12 TaxID=2054166 RepID=UPI000C76DD80|nr:SCO family protein [Bacillus sp. M6-12]PLS16254.1 cytochrome c oxidase assembly protein [Bacillus sp. M6-12]